MMTMSPRIKNNVNSDLFLGPCPVNGDDVAMVQESCELRFLLPGCGLLCDLGLVAQWLPGAFVWEWLRAEDGG